MLKKKILIIIAVAAVSIITRASIAEDIENLSAYYGFREMEIVKLDNGIRGLRILDLNGDGLNDIVVVNNQKSKIEQS